MLEKNTLNFKSEVYCHSCGQPLSIHCVITWSRARALNLRENLIHTLKVKTSIGNAPISKNEMEAPITNHVKEYVLTNTWWYKICRESAYYM